VGPQLVYDHCLLLALKRDKVEVANSVLVLWFFSPKLDHGSEISIWLANVAFKALLCGLATVQTD
jgi:hypothetical protein